MQSEEHTRKIVTLIGKQISGELNAIDKRDLNIWISESESNKILFDQLTDPAYRQGELMEMRSFTSASSAFANFMEKYGERVRVEDDVYIPPKPEVERKRNYESLRYAAAVIVLLTLSIGFFLYLKNESGLKKDIKLSALILNDLTSDGNKNIGATISDVSANAKHVSQTMVLNATQQSAISNNRSMLFEQTPKEDIVWKQGFFVFDGETLESLMRKIAHWYNVEVVYADSNIGKKLCTGSVSRFSDIASLLDNLERTGPAKFKVEGRRILVQSQH